MYSSTVHHDPPDLSFSQKLWHGAYMRLGEDRNVVDEYYKTHYDDLNGTGVEWFEIYSEIYSGILRYRYHAPITLYTIKVAFTSPLSGKEIEEFLGLSLLNDQICVYDEKVKFRPLVKNMEVVYSYEGVQSKTKSAAKITTQT